MVEISDVTPDVAPSKPAKSGKPAASSSGGAARSSSEKASTDSSMKIREELSGGAPKWDSAQGIESAEAHDKEHVLSEKFTFHVLQGAPFRMQDDRGLKLLMMKWGFGEGMQVMKFRYEENAEGDSKKLMQQFFKSPTARYALQAMQVAIISPDKVEVEATPIHTKTMSMELFERLQECGAVGPTGNIRGRFEDSVEDIPVNSVLREVLWMEESDLWDTYTDDERNEFIFRVFKHVQIGGASNQYEDIVDPYLKATKAIYKDLLSVRKNQSGDMEVTSEIFDITSIGHGGSLFRKEHSTNFCYFIVDHLMRHITVWKYNWTSAWG